MVAGRAGAHGTLVVKAVEPERNNGNEPAQIRPLAKGVDPAPEYPDSHKLVIRTIVRVKSHIPR